VGEAAARAALFAADFSGDFFGLMTPFTAAETGVLFALVS
jgi:hypothetical protein